MELPRQPGLYQQLQSDVMKHLPKDMSSQRLQLLPFDSASLGRFHDNHKGDATDSVKDLEAQWISGAAHSITFDSSEHGGGGLLT